MRQLLLTLFWAIFVIVLGNSQVTDSTNILPYPEVEEYEIAGIKVEGAKFSDPRTLTAIAGLKIGQRIRVPGPKITGALRALMDLRLFTDVQILRERQLDELLFLRIVVVEQPRLSDLSIRGVKKSQRADLAELVRPHLLQGAIVTDNALANARRAIELYFARKGFPDALIGLKKMPDPAKAGSQRMVFEIDPGLRVKVAGIFFRGNKHIKDKKLRKLLGVNKKSKLFAKSKLILEEFETGMDAILDYYNTKGYRDARISGDSIWRTSERDWVIEVSIKEGQPYYFGNISWKGNSLYDDEQLSEVLGIEPGDRYNSELLENRLRFSPDGRDISSLYLDDGYLFFRVEANEQAIRGNTIDLEIRLFEGQQATIDRVTVEGNDITNDHVILRELRTGPGDKFSRNDIIRSQRELVNLGYFNPETMEINTPVDPERGTVDIEYQVEEKRSDKFEFSAGWGGTSIGITGTAGFALNNFSLRSVLHPRTWKPFPSGDGQRLSMRIQSNGKAYQSLNLSFTEPWLGGKRPNALSVATFYNRYSSVFNAESVTSGQFNLFGATASLGQRMRWPDDNFISTTALNFQRYDLKDWAGGFFRSSEGDVVANGTFYDFHLSQNFTRTTIDNPLFPTRGSRFSLAMQFTPPYSLFSDKNYSDNAPAEKFRWLEYHKWRFDAEWYTTLTGNLVLKAAAKFGFLGAYNAALGTAPFERFQLGGDGLNNIQGGFTGTDILALRGYEVEDLENNLIDGEPVATPLFNKYTLELRYPLSLNPNATIYGLAFLEGGNAWQSSKDFNPFDIKRSAGLGLRVFLPMFGTLGFDYGIGFDKTGERSLNNMGKFSIILGFEPE